MSERRKMQPLSISEDDYTMRPRQALIQRYPPPKTTIAAILLLLFGSIFLSLGLSVFFASLFNTGDDRGIALMTLGGIMFVPGSYASYVVFGSWRGWENFDYAQIPSYDD